MNDTITLSPGGRTIGPGQPCFIAAEIGINHNGDVALAKDLIAAAAQAGVDGVKFQNYNVDDFLTDRSLTLTYTSAGKHVTESQYALFKRCQLSTEQLFELKEYSTSQGVLFFSTPTGESTINDLVRMGASLLKNGSDFLANDIVVSAMARTGIPTVLSTGMATLAEIEHAVTCFRHAGGTELILLHCTSNYPTAPADIHLRRISTLSAVFNCLVGFSDHSEGITAAIAAIACGCCFLEKHFTIDRNSPGPDHWFSSDPTEMKALVDSVRCVELALGRGSISANEAETASRSQFRLSCVASCDLAGGQVLTPDVIATRRPGFGISPQDADKLIGMRLMRPMSAGEPFLWEYFRVNE